MSDADRQSIDEHMTKFKGRNSCKPYIKNKPIKWGFKWWCRCSSTTGYLYEFNLYLGKKEKTEIGLGESAVLNLSQKLEGSYCTLYFDNFFNICWLTNFMKKDSTVLGQFEKTDVIWLLCRMTAM